VTFTLAATEDERRGFLLTLLALLILLLFFLLFCTPCTPSKVSKMCTYLRLHTFA
jgi:hypothetical protein